MAATVSCLCGGVKMSFTNRLPSDSALCHCNACRHSSGALFVAHVETKHPELIPNLLSKCTSYETTSEESIRFDDTAHQSRVFCSTCGSKLFINHWHTCPCGSIHETYSVYYGAIDPPERMENVLLVAGNQWLEHTGDGGMAFFLSRLKISEAEYPLYMEWFGLDQESQVEDKATECYLRHDGKMSTGSVDILVREATVKPLPAVDETLTAECHCGGVSLRIQRANHRDHSIPQLDRFIPKHGNGQPTNKHMAFCCVCRSCRQHSGNALTPFAYIPAAQIINPHTGKAVAQHHDVDTPAGKEANEGLSLSHYWSSERSCRSFCKVCGASVFYSTDSRPEVVNIAAGLLRADDGAMARRWLSWQWGRTAWKDETIQKNISDAWIATAQG